MWRSVILIVSLTVVRGFEDTLIGESPFILDHRIVGGTKVDIQEHPHQLSLRTSSHICGASIISDKWAVTAAHCVRWSAQKYSVMAETSNVFYGNVYRLKNVIVHPSYAPYTNDYDVALLEIDGEIQFSRNARPIKLAENELYAGALVNITGWGATKEGGKVLPALMKVSVPIVNREECQAAYDSVKITNRMICAGHVGKGGKDSCQGDSGGPLTADNILYGIVSWGYGCARPDYPGVYTNVASVRSWIRAITGV